MKIIKEYLIIMLCLFLGEGVSRVFHLSIPGNVIGMILLLILLLSGVVKLKDVENAADSLIKNLSLFFVPVGAGVMLYFGLLSKYAVPIIGATVLSTFLVFIVTGHIIQLIICLGKKRGGAID